MTTSLTKAYDLSGQVALITGGAQGIGLAIGTLLAE
jgi:NAD(P)-dependent dehydrogenase (short-subunit alcohol dehydrogenase family)